MSDITISNLPPATSIDGADILPIVQSGTTKKAAVSLLGGGGTPAGNDTEIQFNDGGSFGADSAFTWNKTGPDAVDNFFLFINKTLGAELSDMTSSPTGIMNQWFIDVPADFPADIFTGHNTNIIKTGSNSLGELDGLEGNVFNAGTGGILSFLVALFGFATTQGAAAVTTTQIGLFAKAVVNSGGTVTNNVATRIQNLISASTTQNNVGIEVQSPSVTSGGTITGTNYGIHIKDQSSTGAPTAYAIKVDGGNNDLGPGTTTVVFPDSDPHVDGAGYWVAGVLTKSAG